MNKQKAVRDFMYLAGQRTPHAPIIPTLAERTLRVKLIREELEELEEHSKLIIWRGEDNDPDLINIADDLADLLYVVYGAAVAYGIDIAPVFEEVHKANMRKFGEGSSRREDGKWLKPPGWNPPDIKAILDAQGV